MTRPTTERQPEIDGRLEYVRGLLEGGELPPDERRDRTVAELAAAVADLSAAVRDLGAEVTALHADGRSAGPSPGARAQAETMQSIFCPGCGAVIPAGEALRSPGVHVLPCRACGAVVELE